MGRWFTPAELVEIGFSRCRVVMMNEAHNGWLRCPRTRVVGRQILPTAHRMGARHLAMEALDPWIVDYANHNREQPPIRDGYLGQPEMRELIQAALDLGWTLIAYEADWRPQPAGLDHLALTNWREEVQARNLITALAALPGDARMLVWCGNSHLSKTALDDYIEMRPDGTKVHVGPRDPHWTPMGYLFARLGGGDFFALDQTVTVNIHPERPSQLDPALAAKLESLGGTAGFLAGDQPPEVGVSYADRGMDAFVFSIENDMA
jgi:hypothetical protein